GEDGVAEDGVPRPRVAPELHPGPGVERDPVAGPGGRAADRVAGPVEEADARARFPQRVGAGVVGANEVPQDLVARGAGVAHRDACELVPGDEIAIGGGWAAPGGGWREKRCAAP